MGRTYSSSSQLHSVNGRIGCQSIFALIWEGVQCGGNTSHRQQCGFLTHPWAIKRFISAALLSILFDTLVHAHIHHILPPHTNARLFLFLWPTRSTTTQWSNNRHRPPSSGYRQAQPPARRHHSISNSSSNRAQELHRILAAHIRPLHSRQRYLRLLPRKESRPAQPHRKQRPKAFEARLQYHSTRQQHRPLPPAPAPATGGQQSNIIKNRQRLNFSLTRRSR